MEFVCVVVFVFSALRNAEVSSGILSERPDCFVLFSFLLSFCLVGFGSVKSSWDLWCCKKSSGARAGRVLSFSSFFPFPEKLFVGSEFIY